MRAADLHDYFAWLAVLALVGAVVLVVVRLIPSAGAIRFLAAVDKVNLWLATAVAVTATAGSLYFSEHFKWTPCRMCWFQRVFMYSLAAVLLVAAIRRDRSAKWYAGPLAAIGMAVSTWHILIEHGVVGESKMCTTPCAVPYAISFAGRNVRYGPADWWGVTLAVMAFCGFAAILALLFCPEPLDDTDSLEDPDGQPQTS